MEDEGLLLSNPQPRRRAVINWSHLGVDVVRIHARWWEIAPQTDAGAEAVRLQRRTDAEGYNWAPLDTAVATVRATGMRVMLTITGPGPLWASTDPGKHNPRWIPRASDYADFARAVATRYAAGGPLPDLERAQPAGLAAAAVAVRQRAELHAGLAARLPLARAGGAR